jgi:hypothetical protein
MFDRAAMVDEFCFATASCGDADVSPFFALSRSLRRFSDRPG